MVRLIAVFPLLLLPALCVAQLDKVVDLFDSVARLGDMGTRTVLQKVLRYDDAQIERVMAKPNTSLPLHDHAVDLTDENWEAVLTTGTPNPLVAPLPSDTVWVITIWGQDKFSEMLLNGTNLVAQHNSSEAGGTLPSNIRFARLSYATETILTTRWWVWRAPTLVIATDNLRTLRFLKFGSIPPFQPQISSFLDKPEWWTAVTPWDGVMGPDGLLETPLVHLAKIWAFYHRLLSRIPNFILLMLSGAFLNLVIGFFHKTSEIVAPVATPTDTTKPAPDPAVKARSTGADNRDVEGCDIPARLCNSIDSITIMPAAPLPRLAGLGDSNAFDQLLSSIRPVSVPTSPSSGADSPVPARNNNPFFASLRQEELRVHDATVNPTSSTSNLTLTDNLGITNASTRSDLLDLYAELGSVKKLSLPPLLESAWAESPLAALRIIWSTRSIPRGKGHREAWMRAAAFLAEQHPQTLLRNLHLIVKPTDLTAKKRNMIADAEGDLDMGDEDLCDVEENKREDEDDELTPASARSHGSYKDLANLVVLSTIGQLKVMGDYTLIPGCSSEPSSPFWKMRTKRQGHAEPVVEKAVYQADLAARLSDNSSDPFHRSLHVAVARIFGTQLQADIAAMEESHRRRATGEDDEAYKVERRISLAAKWAPTEGGFHSRYSRLDESIAESLFPLNESRTPASLSFSLGQYRRVVSTLRDFLEIVERRMSAKEWDRIQYNRVASRAMSNLKNVFIKHDEEGFRKYLLQVAQGKKSISGATMTPAVLLQHGCKVASVVEAEVVRLQWETLVSSLRDSGALSNCLAVADVSGSMEYPRFMDGTSPIHSSIALSFLVASVTEPPFQGSIITFSDKPIFLDVPSTSNLKDVWRLCQEGMGFNTDFIAIFRLILRRAQESKLAPEQMIKRLFVFSDMEFDQCHARNGDDYATHYETVKSEFDTAGYPIPELVFWNLASSQCRTSKAVTAETPGTALVAGYSAATLKVFLEGGDFEVEAGEPFEQLLEDGSVVRESTGMTPLLVLKKAIGHASFDELKVFD